MGSHPRSIEAVVFDMDGVLIDSEPVWRAVEREVFAKVGVLLAGRDLEDTAGVRIADVVALWKARQPWTGPSVQEVAGEIVQEVARRVERDGTLADGAVDALRYFQRLGLRLGLASSSPMHFIRSVLSQPELDGIFAAVVSAEDEEFGKPDPAVYLSAARMLDVEPERCLAVEDALSGIRAAKAAGMICVAVPERPHAVGPLGEEADLVLGSVAELDETVWARTGTIPSPPDNRNR